jgi:integrase
VKLRVRAGAGGSAASWTKTLPIKWEVGCIGPVTETVAELYAATQGDQPKSLAGAWAELHPEDDDTDPPPGVPSLIGGINWKAIAAAFYRDRQQNGTQVSDRTMALERTYCNKAVELLISSKAPATPYKLIDAAITMGGWSDKPRARQQCVGAITRLLTYGVTHEGLSGDWIIPHHQKVMLAGNGKPKEEREIAILSDIQILKLLDSVPTAAWRNLLLVMAIYGLRPEELTHLTPKVNPTTGKLQLWCSYRKAAGGRTTKTETKPRWLQAIPLRTPEGEDYPADDLAAQINAGLMPFPPLKERGAAVAQYVGRLGLWKEMAATFEEQGKWLRPYSLRNAYSVRGHLRGIPGASMALAMGHSDKTHSAHYVTASEESTAELFERLLGK